MFFRSLVLGILVASLSACNLSGSTQKGPFKAGSTVTVARLNAQAAPVLSSKQTSLVSGRQGSYSFNRIRWNGWTELQVSGQYFDEFIGGNSSHSLALNAITNKNRWFDTANIHLFSHLAAARMKQRVADGQNRKKAWKSTQADMKQVFGLPSVKKTSINRGVEQLSLLRGSGQYRKDNANLLLFTGSFLATSGDAAALQALTEDFADDGEFNGVATDAFHAIAVKAGTTGLLNTLSQNLKNHGVENPPNAGDMPRLPKWVIEDAGDITPPVITVVGESIIQVEEGTVYVDSGATALDDTDGEIVAAVLDGSDSVDTSTAGTSHIVTYTATDKAGNSATATRTVNIIEATIVDTIAPVITISGQNPITVVVGTPYIDEGATALDNTDGVVAAVTVGGSDVIDTSTVITHTVTYKAVDIAGNEATATREVNVVEAPDTEAPVIVLLGNNPDTVEVDKSEAPVLYTDPGYTATDNRDGSVNVEVLGLELIDVSALDVSYTVTYSAKDVAGNTVTIEREVKVVDTTAPVITVDGANPIEVEAGSSFEDVLGATANDNALGAFAATANITAVNTSELGSYEVVYTAVDGKGNVAEPKTRTVNVVDTTAPIISLDGDNPQELYVGAAYIEAGATATDFIKGTFAADADSTAVDMSVPATYKVIYSAQDDAGNIATVIERTVIVSIPPDTTAPQITINGANPEVVEAGLPYVDNNGATATDNVDPSFAATGNILAVDTSVIGDYFVTYTASDHAGNNAVPVKRTVQVRDSIKPVITRIGDASLVIQKNSTYADAGATANDSFEGNITTDIVVGNPVDTSNPATYTVTYDVSDHSSNAAVQVTRSVRVNAPPTANAGADVSVLSGSPVTLIGGATDADGTVVAYQWQRGGVNIPSATASTYSYTPEASETLTLVVTDNDGAIASDAVSVEVTLPPPYQIVFMTDVTSVPRNLDAELFRQGLLAMVSVNDGNGNSIAAEPTFDVSVVNLTTSGTYPMVFSFTDPYGRVITKTLSVIVANSSPVAVGQNISLDEDTVSDTIVLTATDSNEGDTLTYSISAQPSHGALSGQAPNVVYTPAANYFGTDSFEFTVSDGEASSTATVNITVNDVVEQNQAPTANTQELITVEEDSSNNAITLTGTDADGDSLTYEIVDYPANGDIIGDGQNYTYTPKEDYSGSDSFSFTVSDAHATSAPATINITVTDDNNHAPVANTQELITVMEDSSGNVITLVGTDADGDSLTYEIDDYPDYGDIIVDGQNYTYTPNEDYSGADSFSFTVSDGDDTSAPATINIMVTDDGNHAPTASSQELITVEMDSSNNAITLAGTDADNDPLTYAIDVSPEHGTLVGGAGQNYTYTPDRHYSGLDSFSFTVNDGDDVSASVKININVEGINEIPTKIVFTGGLTDSLSIGQGQYANYESFEVAELLDENYEPKAMLLNQSGENYLSGDYYIEIEPMDFLPSGEPVYFDPSVAGEYQLNFISTFETGKGLPPTIIEKVLTVFVGDQPDQSSPISGRVLSTDNTVVDNVTIRMLSNGAEMFNAPLDNFITNGVFNFGMPSDQEYTIVLTAPEFANQVIPIKTPANAQPLALGDITMIARGQPQAIIDGATPVVGANGASVLLNNATFTDSQGNNVELSNIQVTITPVDVSSPVGLAAFPGSFTGITDGGSQTPIISFGTVEYVFTRNGEELTLVGNAEIEIPIYVSTHQDGTAIVAGDVIPLWSLNEDTGIWLQEGTGTVVNNASSPTGLALRATVSHFTWWNADALMESGNVIISVTAPKAGVATIRARTTNSGWRSGNNGDTVIGVGNSTGAIPVPSGIEVCYSARVAFTDGSVAITNEKCTTVASGQTGNISLVVPDAEMALKTRSATNVSTYINVAAVPINILPTTPEAEVNYVIESGVLPAGVTLTSVNNTTSTISGVPTESGVFSVVIKGTDTDGSTATLTINYSVTAGTAAPNLVGDSSLLTLFVDGNEYSRLFSYSDNFVTLVNRNGTEVEMYRANRGGVVQSWSVSNFVIESDYIGEYEEPEPVFAGEVTIDESSGKVTIGLIGNAISISFDVTATNSLGSSVLRVTNYYRDPFEIGAPQ